MWKESFVFTLKSWNEFIDLKSLIKAKLKDYLIKRIFIYEQMMKRDIPGALLGVVGGAGVLKGSKLTDSEFDWDCFFCGRGVAGDRDVLLG